MGSHWATGDPDETYGPILVADVVRVLRDLEPGFHTVREVRERYQRATGAPDSPDLHLVASVVTRLGTSRHVREGENGWHIDPGALAARWPRLPWSD